MRATGTVVITSPMYPLRRLTYSTVIPPSSMVRVACPGFSQGPTNQIIIGIVECRLDFHWRFRTLGLSEGQTKEGLAWWVAHPYMAQQQQSQCKLISLGTYEQGRISHHAESYTHAASAASEAPEKVYSAPNTTLVIPPSLTHCVSARRRPPLLSHHRCRGFLIIVFVAHQHGQGPRIACYPV